MFLLKFVGIIFIYTINSLEVSDWVGEWATTWLPWQLLLVRCVLRFRVTSAEDPAVYFLRTTRHIQYTSQYSFWAHKSSVSMQVGILGWLLVQRWADRKWGWKCTAQRMVTPDPLPNTCGLSIRNVFLLYQQHILRILRAVSTLMWGRCRYYDPSVMTLRLTQLWTLVANIFTRTNSRRRSPPQVHFTRPPTQLSNLFEGLFICLWFYFS